MRFHQLTDLTSQRQFKKSVLGLFVAFICALFAAGCSSGGGGGDFVASPGGSPAAGGGNANAGNGSVTFNFVQGQTDTIRVPVNTVNLRFEFFSGLSGTGALLKSETRPFATTVTIDDVPSSVRSTVVTALTAEGFPLRTFTGSVSVPANGTTVVDPLAGTTEEVTVNSVVSSPVSVSIEAAASFQVVVTVNFSNGDSVRLDNGLESNVVFATGDGNIASVDANGNITGINNGRTNITASFNGTVITIPVSVGTGTVAPAVITSVSITTTETGDPIQLPRGAATTDPVTVTVTRDNGDVTVLTTPEELATVTFNTAPTTSNVFVDATGRIAVPTDAVATELASITATFGGTTSANGINVEVTDAELSSVSVIPPSLSLPYGGFEQSVTATGLFTDGTTTPLAVGDLTFDSNGSPLFSVDANGVVTSALTGTNPGSGTLTITTTGQTPNRSVDVTVNVGDVTVVQLNATPNTEPPTPAVILGPGDGVSFTITASLSDGTNGIDVTNFEALTATVIQASGTNIVANGNNVVAVSPTPTGNPAQVVFSLGGATATVNVTVLDEFLTSVKYFFGGIEFTGDAGVNLPRGYVGIVEVEGTFNTGVTRMLNFNEYSVSLQNDTNTDPRDMIRLFNESYTITQPSANYLDGAPVDLSFMPGPAFTDEDAVVDDLYIFGSSVRVADPNASGSTSESAITPVVATRNTFRAIAADWPRGEANGNVPFSPLVGFTPPGEPIAPAIEDVSPGSVDLFDVTLAASVVDPGNPAEFNLEGVSCTVVDPVRMEYAEAGFANYPDLASVPIGMVREFQVTVNFDTITVDDTDPQEDGTVPATGGEVARIEGWKLAEANVLISSSSLGQNPFARQAPTSLGFPGVLSPNAIQVNNLSLRALPLPGVGVRPILLSEPVPATALVPYQAGTYVLETRVFGATVGVNGVNNPSYTASRDPGPLGTDRASRAPTDGLEVIVQEPQNATIDFVTPFLFTLAPINDGGPIELEIGEGQVFRTLVQFGLQDAPIDVSLDYKPTLIANATTPAFASRADGGMNPIPGRINVSAIDAAGAAVTAADVLAKTGFANLSADANVAAALGAEGIVVSIDIAGNPITPIGSFTDSNMVTGPAQSVTTVEAIPAP